MGVCVTLHNSNESSDRFIEVNASKGKQKQDI